MEKTYLPIFIQNTLLQDFELQKVTKAKLTLFSKLKKTSAS